MNMKYKKAEYEMILKCPDCGHIDIDEGYSMPEPDGFLTLWDKEGRRYIKCSCGCEFVE